MTAGRWRRRASAASLIALVVLLPALVAGRSLDAPAAPGEWERLRVAAEVERPGAGELFLLAQVDVDDAAELPAPESPAAAALLGRARLSQLLGVLGISLLTYLAVMFAHGRGRALLSCAVLAGLSPVAVDGHVLRAETGAGLFGGLSLVLLLGIPPLQRRVRRRASTAVAIGLTGAAAIALAVDCTPSAGILLLVPFAIALLSMAVLMVRLVAVARRRLWIRIPVRATASRLWPWVFASLASMTVTALVLATGERDGVPGARGAAGLLPPAAWLAWPLVLLAVLGAVRLVVRSGLRLGRAGGITSDLVVFVWCAILVAQWLLRDGDVDAMPAAAPVAVLVAEGAVFGALLVAMRCRPRPPAARA